MTIYLLFHHNGFAKDAYLTDDTIIRMDGTGRSFHLIYRLSNRNETYLKYKFPNFAASTKTCNDICEETFSE